MKKALLAKHRKHVSVFGYLPMLFLFLFISACFASPPSTDQSNVNKPTKEEIIQKAQKLQMPFIANDGQTDERVKFYSNTFGGTVFVTKDGEIVYALPEGNESAVGDQGLGIGGQPDPRQQTPDHCGTLASKKERRGVVLKEDFSGGKIKGITGETQSVTKVSYFKGDDPSKWKSSISTYEVVDMGEVYEGVDIKLRAYGSNIEKLFYVKPGADPKQIKISLGGIQPLKSPFVKGEDRRHGGDVSTKSPLEKGARGLWVNEQGELEAETELGTVKFTKPVAYQEIEGKRVEVEVEYSIQESAVGDQGLGIEGTESRGAEGQGGRGVLETQNSKPETRNSKPTYSFKVASYDKTKDLIIDPLLASTFLGGSGDDCGNSVAIDAGGNVYVTGYTASWDFPTTPGAYQTYKGGYTFRDVFVSRLSGDLTKLLASTFLGGSANDDGYSVAIDGGNVYVTGWTWSTDFPTTAGAYQTSYIGGNSYGGDAFVSRLSGDLTKLLASTYLGGSCSDWGYSVAIDADGNVYVTGRTGSTDFPTTSGAYQTAFKGGQVVFVSRLSGDLTKLLASTFLGGSRSDGGFSVAIDRGGNVYVTGWTWSTDFPTTPGAYQTSYKGNPGDAFVSRFSGDLTKLLASTFLGGSHEDQGNSVAIDTGGNVYVTGYTASWDFPTTPGAYQTSYKGYPSDAFVSRFSGDLTKLLASTFLGGSHEDQGNSVAIDGGNVYVTGWTWSTDFPTTPGAYQTSLKGYGYDDVFVSRLSGDLTKLLASTFLGGSHEDQGNSVAIDTGGNVYVTGYTISWDFPKTPGAYQTSKKGGMDAFVSRLDANLSGGSATPPKVTTGAVISVTATSATLSGTVNPEGLSTSAWFEGGPLSGLYTKKVYTSKKKTNLTGTSDLTGNFTVYKLKPNTTYYYRLCATNGAGTSYGSGLSFTTLSK